MSSFLGVPVMIRGHAWGNLYLTEKEEGEFDDADEQSAVILAEWAAIAVENARLYRSVAEPRRGDGAGRAQTRSDDRDRPRGRRRDRPRADPRDRRQARPGAGRSPLAADLAPRRRRARPRLDRRRARRPGGRGADPDRRLDSRPGDRGGRAAPGDRPRPEPDGAPRPPGGRRHRPARPARSSAARRSACSIALDPLGRDSGFSDEDEQDLVSFAASAAIAVATAQSVAEERTRESIAATERERGRWARELHDESLQSLAGLRVLLSAARRSDSRGNRPAAPAGHRAGRQRDRRDAPPDRRPAPDHARRAGARRRPRSARRTPGRQRHRSRWSSISTSTSTPAAANSDWSARSRTPPTGWSRRPSTTPPTTARRNGQRSR